MPSRRRGTLRDPGPDLHRLPTGLDFAGISMAEGVRAALASAIFIVINQWMHFEPLTIAASAAMITCFCDTGGTLRQRLPMLLSFTVLGAVTWAAFGLLRQAGLPVVLPCAAMAVFLFSMARVWGLRAQTVGNILIVVLALALDLPLTPPQAAVFAAAFLVGGFWACLLTAAIWRLQPDRPALQAVADVWGRLGVLVADLRALTEAGAPPAAWDAHARRHRRAVRAAIENARGLVAGSVRRRGLVSGRGARAAVSLEIADQVFGELIVLSELLEAGGDTALRRGAARTLRRLHQLFRMLAADRPRTAPRLLAGLDRIAADPGPAPLDRLVGLAVDRLRVAVRVLENPAGAPLSTVLPSQADRSWRERLVEPLRGELTWQSAILRHAVRATILTVPAIAIALVWWTPYAHWLSITVALTMQPFFAATWQRALERIAGTLAGGLIGGALAFLPQTPLALGAALVPLSILGFSVRQVSYGAYVACLTPLIVVLFDIVEPGHSPAVVAGMRILYTVIGGVVAVGACMVLWPSWEPVRLRRELAAALHAYGRLAVAMLERPTPRRTQEAEAARRAAGLANNNFEASLARALQEPGHGQGADLVRIVAADAVLRRLGAALLAVSHDPLLDPVLEGGERLRWQRYLGEAFAALAAGGPLPAEVPAAPSASTLERVRRGIETLGVQLAAGRAAGG